MKKIMLVLIAFALVAFPATAYANTHTGDGGDMPFYARIERDGILHTDEWAVIVFYRPPECVPADFNLLDIMDFNAFSCTPPTTDGLIIWSGEAWISTPIQIKLHGLGAVPVWFVDWQELQYAIADDSLTMTELEGMPSLIKGSAALYTETLHPTGEVKVPMLNYVARGTLENGHSFFVHALVVVDKVTKVQIKFQ